MTIKRAFMAGHSITNMPDYAHQRFRFLTVNG